MRYQDQYDESELQQYCRALNQRARLLGIDDALSSAVLLACILDSSGMCQWCGRSVVNDEFEIDHIVSLSRGGRNTADNVALACPDCNRRKGDKHPTQFAAEVFARSGNKTPLINRVLSRYDGDVLVQRRLFDEPPSEDSSSTIPPYTW